MAIVALTTTAALVAAAVAVAVLQHTQKQHLKGSATAAVAIVALTTTAALAAVSVAVAVVEQHSTKSATVE